MEKWNPTAPEIPTHRGGIAPTEVNLPESEDNTYIDTMSMQLDRALQLIHGTQAWFDANPQHKNFTFHPNVPSDDTRREEQYVVTITRSTLQTLKEIALTRFQDLSAHSELGHDLARDVVKSWKEPTNE